LKEGEDPFLHVFRIGRKSRKINIKKCHTVDFLNVIITIFILQLNHPSLIKASCFGNQLLNELSNDFFNVKTCKLLCWQVWLC